MAFTHNSILCAIFFFCSGTFLGADDGPTASSRIPKVGCPEADFYNAAGFDVTLKAEASPTELTMKNWLIYTLTVSNLLNAGEVEKPSLKKLEGFAIFQIDESSSLDPTVDPNVKDRRVFVYKLRPSSVRVGLIPEIAFHYYDPRIKAPQHRPQLAFPKRYSNAIPIHVTAAVELKEEAVIERLDVPDFALHFAAGDRKLSREVAGWLWIVGILIPPSLSVFWVIAWRRFYPNAARQGQLKRHRAVRKALASFELARRLNSQEVAGIFIEYLHARFGMPLHENTPLEIAAYLHSISHPKETTNRTARFFRDCDEARFSPELPTVAPLIQEAESLILALEEAA